MRTTAATAKPTLETAVTSTTTTRAATILAIFDTENLYLSVI